MYAEDELLPISALQHLAFCERQWALIHIEGWWTENRLTAEGRILHQHVHSLETKSRGELQVANGLRLKSLHLGLTGIADVVEFYSLGIASEQNENNPFGVRLPKRRGLWRPFPVEYKRGQVKKNKCDEIQLCAQALCLEEMLKVNIASGALFYGRPRRRHEVIFDDSLRYKTTTLANRLHTFMQSGKTPPPVYDKKCQSCSLRTLCIPKAAGKSVAKYLNRVFAPTEKER